MTRLCDICNREIACGSNHMCGPCVLEHLKVTVRATWEYKLIERFVAWLNRQLLRVGL